MTVNLIGEGASYIDNKYLYGNFAFEDMNFSIGLDVNSFSLTNLGLTENNIDLSYIYKIPINFDTYILGALTLGIGSDNIDRGALIFKIKLTLPSEQSQEFPEIHWPIFLQQQTTLILVLQLLFTMKDF
ncbi:MAG: hypothetical protein CM15mP83_3710 [Flavobacteriaceae bacterium]|nr:MAG: hypothetical protein CM15mP83_3710 [Flavobacteriaceae bacterium]